MENDNKGGGNPLLVFPLAVSRAALQPTKRLEQASRATSRGRVFLSTRSLSFLLEIIT